MYPDARRYLLTGEAKKFYDSADWQHLRLQVLEMDHRECQHCKEKGRHTRADRVHHVNEALKRPDLALSIWYTNGQGEQQRNLVSLCHSCHEAVHCNRFPKKEPRPPLTEERW